MPEHPLILLGLVVIAALAFDFINGFHDTANAIATSVSTRALSIRNAILMARIEGLTIAEIAGRTGRTRENVSLLVYRAVKRFREVCERP